MRLGMYADNVYRREGDRVATVQEVYAFMLFVTELRRHVDAFVLFGRTGGDETGADHLLPEGVELAELPYYESLSSPRGVLGALVGSARAMWRGLDRVDAVWVFGPNPFSIALVLLALAKRKRVVLAVRQDTVRYYRSRLPSGAWTPVMGIVHAMNTAYRLLGRRLPVTAVGTELAGQYGWPRPGVLPFTVTLIRPEDVAAGPAREDWDGSIHLLAVGRVDREKDPLLLVEALAELGPRFFLTWAGTGPLEAEVLERARELGVAGRLELRGFVPYGEELRTLYRESHALVHAALTEGVPGAIVEALAFGLPVVATRVGGVPHLLQDGRIGLLVPPRDGEAMVGAVRSLAEVPELRARLVAGGLEVARAQTLDAEVERVAGFLRGVRR